MTSFSEAEALDPCGSDGDDDDMPVEVSTAWKRRKSTAGSIFNTSEAAYVGVHSLDEFDYKVVYNYGSKGYGVRTFKCVSHLDCERRVRISPRGDGFVVASTTWRE